MASHREDVVDDQEADCAPLQLLSVFFLTCGMKDSLEVSCVRQHRRSDIKKILANLR